MLLLADEQENMIDIYLEKGTIFVIDDYGIKAECVVADGSDGILEIKNIAVNPECQGRGYGRNLIEFIVSEFKNLCTILQVAPAIATLQFRFMKNEDLYVHIL